MIFEMLKCSFPSMNTFADDKVVFQDNDASFHRNTETHSENMC